jgi:glycine cleavage system regulatory protein
MKSILVVTLTCADRPGIVDEITEVISAHDANWEESRMAHLGGEFAGIVKISVPAEKAAALTAALRALENNDMVVVVKATEAAPPEAEVGHAIYEIQLTGADHEGIVHAVSHYLASQGINVEAMETQVVPAPVTATPLFQMQAHVKVPQRLSRDDLSSGLDHLAHDLGVDIEVHPAGS